MADAAVVESVLRFMDVTRDAMDRAGRPAYAETCRCGGQIEVGKDVPAVERKRLEGAFHARHAGCVEPRNRSGDPE